MTRRELIENHVEKARGVIRRQGKALSTERDYCGWLRRYLAFTFTLARGLSSEAKAEAFLTMLVTVHDVAVATQNSAFSAILFFYKDVMKTPLKDVDALRASRPQQMRHAPTVEETRALLAAVKDVGGYPTNLVARLLYGAGLRVTEPLNLRIKDVKFEDSSLFILGAKGGKDRVVRLPCSLAVETEQQMTIARRTWEMDVRNGVPVALPHQLGRKYPEYRSAWAWAWLFPAHRPCGHPRTGETVRWRMHEANVQRAVKEARRKLGLAIVPHELRHAYATHNLDMGVNVVALSKSMGHSQIQTTAGYCHAEALSVPSPLDRVKSSQDSDHATGRVKGEAAFVTGRVRALRPFYAERLRLLDA